MATIGALNVKLALSTQAFAKGVEKARAGLASMAKAAKVTTAAVAGVGVALGGAFILLGKFVSSQADAAVSTIRLADQLDIGTEALIGLQHAAAQVHVTTSELNAGLQQLNKVFGQVEAGSAFTQSVFEQLGLSGAKLAGLPLNQAFGQIGDALNKIADPTQRASLAFQLFGNQAKTLLPVLLQGAKGLEANTEEAKKLGIAFDRAGGQNLLNAQRAFANLKEAFSGIFTTLAIKLAPIVTVISTKVLEFLNSGPGLAGRLAAFIDGIAAAIPEMAKSLQGVTLQAIEFGQALLTSLQKVVTGFIKANEALSGRQGSKSPGARFLNVVSPISNFLPSASDLLGLDTRQFSEGLAGVNRGIGTAERGLARLGLRVRREGLGNLAGGALKSAAENIRKMAEEAKKLQQGGGAVAAVDRFAGSFAKVPGLFAQAQTPIERFRDNLDELNFLFDRARIKGDLFARSAAREFYALESAIGQNQIRLPRALKAGTSEAASAIVRFEAEQRRFREDPQARVERVLREALDESKVRTRLQQEIADAIKAIDIEVLAKQ